MSKPTFVLKSKASTEMLKKQNEKAGFAKFSMKGKLKARLLVLPPVDVKEAVFFVTNEYLIFGSGKQLKFRTGAPEVFNNTNHIAEIGWKIREKYSKSKDEGLKTFYKEWLPTKKMNINVLDLDNLDVGPQVYALSGTVEQTIIDELVDVGEDLTSICDFADGRILQVKSNGASGISVRYTAKFLSETASLDLSDEEMESLASKLKPLSGLQVRCDDAKLLEIKEYLSKVARDKYKIDVSELTADSIDDETIEEEVLEEEEQALDEELDEDIEQIEVKKVPVKGKVLTKKTTVKVVEEEELEEDLEEEFEEEEVKKAPVKGKVLTKKTAVKVVEEEEFEEELGEEDLEEEDLEEENVKKVPVKGKFLTKQATALRRK